MASIRRTDIIHKKYSKCRLAKSDRERVYNRHEAYKWRDARRVHLAGSFDRWRKLRSSLKLKDSSLAWHLMEAHDKGYCRHSNFQSSNEREKQRRKCDQKEFLPSLLASVRQLCHAHFDFNECIEIIGLLCLEFDKTRKENFSLNECIRSDSPYYVSKSSQEQHVHSLQETSLSHPYAHISEIHQLDVSTHEPKVVSRTCSAASVDTELSANVDNTDRLKQKLVTSGLENMDILFTTSSRQNAPLENLSGNMDSLPKNINNCSDVENVQNYLSIQPCSSFETEDSDGKCVTYEEKMDEKHQLMNSSMCSESEPSLEIDIEKMDTSQEEDPTDETLQAMNPQILSPNPRPSICHEGSSETLSPMSKNVQNTHIVKKAASQCNKGTVLPSTKFKPGSVDQSDVPKCHLAKPENTDLPLDMSVLKPIVKKEIDSSTTSHGSHDCGSDTPPQNYRCGDGTHSELAQFSSSAAKRKISETNSVSSQSLRQSPFWLEGFHSLPGKMKEESHTSIPWQRRDMSRKEEYEYLEMNPFSDLADFSQRYPHVHQRTYYRWKRRIKEEYIILEQCPGMSFQEFSSVVLQAKESVFCHWKSLISQGKGFFAPSDTSKRLETKSPLKLSSHHNSAYAFMQKNLTLTYEQFCQQYPGTPIDVFNVLKRKAMQEFWLFHQNQHMSHKDFSKLVNISEDVFNTWKKCVEYFRSNTLSPNLKPVSNSISPNSHMSIPSFHSLDSSHSSSDLQQLQSAKDGLFNMKDSNTIFKESKATAQAGGINSALSDSAARSLSNSYLASLQNMMFPWHNYYGMTSSIGQQMLPMMLWPGMMGLAGGISSSLGLMSSSHADVAPQSTSVAGLHRLLGTASESTESMKSDESHSNHSDEHVNSNNKLGSAESRELSRNQISSDGEKRLKMSHDKEDVDILGSVSRSRKQNKQEYIYYLKNPELCFKELETLFPSISLRTFYRWRKEMNAAVLLLEDNKNMTFHQFQMVFPDIPEDIFELWKERVGSGGLSPTLERQSQQSTESSEELSYSNQSLHLNDQNSIDQAKPLESNKTDLTDSQSNRSIVKDGTRSSGDSAALLRKNVKEGYYFVQKNPNIDLASFSTLYPDTSVRSFYRWKKELKDAVDFLKTNPEMIYDAYKTIDATVSEEVFNVWKSLALDKIVIKEEITEDSTVADERNTSMLNLSDRKFTGSEYWFLQLNPYIEFSQFTRTYPDVPKRTFHRWKQEIEKIMSYIQAKPSIQFADIASVLPQVSEDAFNKWKHIVATASENPVDTKNTVKDTDTQVVMHKFEIDEDTKSQMTEALLYLMHNPTIKYNHFKIQFDFVSAATFELWLKRIKTVILYIASNPSIEYTTFSSNIKDVAKDIFEMWKNLSSDAIAALQIGCVEDLKENVGTEPRIISVGQNTDKAFQPLEAFEFFQKNPKMTFSTFQSTYPNVSEKLFSDWISRTQEELQYIRENPDLQWDAISKMYPHTKQGIFDLWKSESSSSKPQHFVQESSDDALLEMIPEENALEDLKPHLYSNKLKGSKIKDSTKGHNEGKEKFNNLYTEDYIKENEVVPLNVNKHLNNGPKESSLSKLTKFADSGTLVDSSALPYTKKSLTRKLSSSFDQLLKNNNKALKLEPLFSSDVDNFVDVSDTTTSAHHLHSKMSSASEIEAGEVCSTNPLTATLNTSSLSALMAMSRSDDAHNSGNQVASPHKEKPGHSITPLCSGSPNWQRTSNGLGAFGCGGITKEDDEAFSSQRQKKMSRAEYLFVKDNPDVDSQEFSRIFPGVSARTFYRWKKEIKAQLNLP